MRFAYNIQVWKYAEFSVNTRWYSSIICKPSGDIWEQPDVLRVYNEKSN